MEFRYHPFVYFEEDLRRCIQIDFVLKDRNAE